MKVLRDEAKREGITVNSLMNRILEDYGLFHRYYARYSVVTMTQSTLRRMVELCPEEDLREIAKKGGIENFKDIARTLGFELTHENLIFFITKVCGKYVKWFKVEHYLRKGIEVFHMRHHMGKKWSLYIAEVMSAIFKYSYDKRANIDIIEGGLTVEVPLPKTL